jgi:hypothetical protein
MLLYVTMALLFGAVMPVLFFEIMFCMILLWFLNRTLLAYYYPMPPNFNDVITLAIFKILKWIPIFTLPVVWWLLGNK